MEDDPSACLMGSYNENHLPSVHKSRRRADVSPADGDASAANAPTKRDSKSKGAVFSPVRPRAVHSNVTLTAGTSATNRSAGDEGVSTPSGSTLPMIATGGAASASALRSPSSHSGGPSMGPSKQSAFAVIPSQHNALGAERIMALASKQVFVPDPTDDAAGGNTMMAEAMADLRAVLYPRDRLGLCSSGTRTDGYVPYRTGKGPLAASFIAEEATRKREAFEEAYTAKYGGDGKGPEGSTSPNKQPRSQGPMEMFRPKPPIAPYPKLDYVGPESSPQAEEDPNVAAIRALFAQRAVHDGLLHTPSVPINAKCVHSPPPRSVSPPTETIDWQEQRTHATACPSNTRIAFISGRQLLNKMHLAEAEESQSRVLLAIAEANAIKALAGTDLGQTVLRMGELFRDHDVAEVRRLLWAKRDKLPEEDQWLARLGHSGDDAGVAAASPSTAVVAVPPSGGPSSTVGDLIEAEFEALQMELTLQAKATDGSANPIAKALFVNLAVIHRTVGMVMGTLWREEEREWTNSIYLPTRKALVDAQFKVDVGHLIVSEDAKRTSIAASEYGHWYVPFTDQFCETFHEKLRIAHEESTRWRFMNLLQQVEADEVAARHKLVVEFMGCGPRCIHSRDLSSRVRMKVERDMKAARDAEAGAEVSTAWVGEVGRGHHAMISAQNNTNNHSHANTTNNTNNNSSRLGAPVLQQQYGMNGPSSISNGGASPPQGTSVVGSSIHLNAASLANVGIHIDSAYPKQATKKEVSARKTDAGGDDEDASSSAPSTVASSPFHNGSTDHHHHASTTIAVPSPTIQVDGPTIAEDATCEPLVSPSAPPAPPQPQAKEALQQTAARSLLEEADEAYLAFIGEHKARKAAEEEERERGRIASSSVIRRSSLLGVGASEAALMASENGTEVDSYAAGASNNGQQSSSLLMRHRPSHAAYVNVALDTPRSAVSPIPPPSVSSQYSTPYNHSYDPTRISSLPLLQPHSSPVSGRRVLKSPMLQVVTVPPPMPKSPTPHVGSSFRGAVGSVDTAANATVFPSSQQFTIGGLASSCAQDLYAFDDKISMRRQQVIEAQLERRRDEDTIPEALLIASDCTCRLSNFIDHYYTTHYIEAAYAEIKTFVDVALQVTSAWVTNLRRRNVKRLELLNSVILKLESSVVNFTSTEEATAAALEFLKLPDDPLEAVYVGEWRDRRLLEIESTNERQSFFDEFHERQRYLASNRFSYLTEKAMWAMEDAMEAFQHEMSLLYWEGKARLQLLEEEQTIRREFLVSFSYFSVELVLFEERRRASIAELEDSVYFNYLGYFHNTFQRVGTVEGIVMERWQQSLNLNEHRYRLRIFKSEDTERAATIALYSDFIGAFTHSLVAFNDAEGLARERLLLEEAFLDGRAHLAGEERRSRVLLNNMGPSGAALLMVLRRDEQQHYAVDPDALQRLPPHQRHRYSVALGATTGTLQEYGGFSIRGDRHNPNTNPMLMLSGSINYEASMVGAPPRSGAYNGSGGGGAPLTAAALGLLLDAAAAGGEANAMSVSASPLITPTKAVDPPRRVSVIASPIPANARGNTSEQGEGEVVVDLPLLSRDRKLSAQALPFRQHTARTDSVIRGVEADRRMSVQHQTARRSSLGQALGIMGPFPTTAQRSDGDETAGGLTQQASFSVALLAIKRLEEQTAPSSSANPNPMADPMTEEGGDHMQTAEGFAGFGSSIEEDKRSPSPSAPTTATNSRRTSVDGAPTPISMVDDAVTPVGVGIGFRRPSLQEIAFAAATTSRREVPQHIQRTARLSLQGAGLLPPQTAAIINARTLEDVEMSFRPRRATAITTGDDAYGSFNVRQQQRALFDTTIDNNRGSFITAATMDAAAFGNHSHLGGGGLGIGYDAGNPSLLIANTMGKDIAGVVGYGPAEESRRLSVGARRGSMARRTSVGAGGGVLIPTPPTGRGGGRPHLAVAGERPSYAAVQQVLALETCADLRYNAICPLGLDDLEDIFL